MNRAERRRAMRQGLPIHNEPVFNVKRSDLTQMKEKATSEAIDTAFVLMVAIPVVVMHEKYGWSMKKRLPELAEAIVDEYQRFSDGEMTVEQYQDYVFEYCGMKFKKNDEEE